MRVAASLKRPMCWSLKLLALGVAAWIATPALSQETGAESQPTLEASIGREVPLGPDRPFVAPDDRFRVLLPFPLAAEPTVDGEQVALVLDLGTQMGVNCFFQLDGLDPASSIARVSEASLPVGAEGSKILTRQIRDIDAFPVGAEVVLATDWLYRFQQDDDTTAAGMLKLRAASLGAGGVVCLHDEVGYSGTLDRIVEHLVRTWTGTSEDSPPVFQETTALRINGLTTGLKRFVVSLDAEGDYFVRLLGSDLLPIDTNTLRGEESFDVDYADATGALINSINLESDSDQLATRLELSRDSDTTWLISGTFQSKPLEHQIEYGDLTSELSDRKQLRQFLAGAKAGDRLVQNSWMAATDPTSITEVAIDYVGRSGDLHVVEVVLGEIRMKSEVDDHGSIVRAEFDIAGAKVELERVYQSGVFPDVVPAD